MLAVRPHPGCPGKNGPPWGGTPGRKQARSPQGGLPDAGHQEGFFSSPWSREMPSRGRLLWVSCVPGASCFLLNEAVGCPGWTEALAPGGRSSDTALQVGSQVGPGRKTCWTQGHVDDAVTVMTHDGGSHGPLCPQPSVSTPRLLRGSGQGVRVSVPWMPGDRLRPPGGGAGGQGALPLPGGRAHRLPGRWVFPGYQSVPSGEM